jgi:truncated hemoglobin YjbI
MPAPTEQPLKNALKSLYKNIGESDGLRTILRDFYLRMSQDTMIGFFFAGKNIVEIADRQHQFISRAMGASASYTGKPPAQAHEALPPILPGHFDRRLRILEETLRTHGLSAEDIRTWLEFENSFRAGIVSEPTST